MAQFDQKNLIQYFIMNLLQIINHIFITIVNKLLKYLLKEA
jgi:hypothetical protein